ncbi:MAG TPA: glutathione S-transferase N-terminal domain-containing protein [Novosphingobium sp.]|nr:glutathione S-transferase N-terminal domain-containing protein [Novosphingobium sp.]HQA18271.1 glutathione S-transferase N-terminal domain-containing protein [Novosphingobium sp.]
MITLYYKPLSCSLAVHIALRELDLPFELVAVTQDGDAKLAGGADYLAVHPLGAVPAVTLGDGSVMAEAGVILEYLPLLAEGSTLAPRPGDADYWEFRQLMNFIATDIHKNYGPLFIPGVPDTVKPVWLNRMAKRFDHLSARIAAQGALLARGYSVANIYFYVMLLWCSYVGVDLARWPVLAEYFERLSARIAVREALEIERP